MRISTALSQQLGVNSILGQQSKLQKTQQQIGAGVRLLTPSDDPAASVRVLEIEQSISETRQFQDNISSARTRLSLEESTLGNVTDILQRVRELSVQAVNGTLTAEQRVGIEEESRQLLDELLGLANTRGANGEYLFGGFKSQTVPFTGDANSGGFAWQGDSRQRQLQIGPARQIQDGDPGLEVFWDVEHSSGTNQSLFQSVFDFADHISAVVDNPDPSDITNIDLALDNIIEVRSRVGARLNALDQQEALNEDFILDMETVLSDTRDLDFAGAVSRLNLETVALQAAQQAYIRVQGLSLFNFL